MESSSGVWRATAGACACCARTAPIRRHREGRQRGKDDGGRGLISGVMGWRMLTVGPFLWTKLWRRSSCVRDSAVGRIGALYDVAAQGASDFPCAGRRSTLLPPNPRKYNASSRSRFYSLPTGRAWLEPACADISTIDCWSSAAILVIERSHIGVLLRQKEQRRPGRRCG